MFAKCSKCDATKSIPLRFRVEIGDERGYVACPNDRTDPSEQLVDCIGRW